MEIGIERILAKNFMVVWCNLRGMGCVEWLGRIGS
jgi:hypothetical protein